MNLNELIKKYEEKIDNACYYLANADPNINTNKYKEFINDKNNYKEILSDLEKLKEKISAKTSKCKDGTMNDAYIFYLEKEIIGE